MRRSFSLLSIFAVYGGTRFRYSGCQSLPEPLHVHGSLTNATRAEAAKLLEEFEGREDVKLLMADKIIGTAPAVTVGGIADCPVMASGQEESFSRLALQGLGHTQIVTVNETGRACAPCPKVMLSVTPYYGHKGAPMQLTSPPPATLSDIKQTIDLTRLGLEMSFDEKAYEALQICNNFFFSTSETGVSAGSSDPSCIVAHLDESSASIKALDPENLRPLPLKLQKALLMIAKLTFKGQKKEWITNLLASKSLRLAWHVIEAFSDMNITMLGANVGEALNAIALKDATLVRPLRDLIQFATTCTIYEDYPEKSWQDLARYPNPDSPQHLMYPVYDYLRRVGAEVSFPKEIPPGWQPRVYDGNRKTPRRVGEREAFNFQGDWKRQVYNSWHNLWILQLIMYDAGSMWEWSQKLNASTFFFKPWNVTRVVTGKMVEAAPLRYRNLTPRFRVDPSVPPAAEDYAGCPAHLTDLEFFAKVKAPVGQLTAEWHQGDIWNGLGFLDKAEHCPASHAKVRCPPRVHPDKCGVDATYLRTLESPWLYRLERDPASVTWPTDVTNNDYVDKIWAARGTASPKLWLLNTMSDAVTHPDFSSSGAAKIHSGFLFLFQKATKSALDDDMKDLAMKIAATRRRQVVLFTGHSLGGAVAQLAAWYYARKARKLIERNLLQVRCVTFGTPAWGNSEAYNEFLSSGVVAHDVATNLDPVTTLNGEPAFGDGIEWRKPFHFRIMVEDMSQVFVASSNRLEPDFYGQLWTRKELHAQNFLKRTFGALANIKNIDSVFLYPVLTHFLSYTACLTVMADMVPEAGFGSGLAAPLVDDPPINYAAHSLSASLYAAQPKMRWVLTKLAGELRGTN